MASQDETKKIMNIVSWIITAALAVWMFSAFNSCSNSIEYYKQKEKAVQQKYPNYTRNLNREQEEKENSKRAIKNLQILIDAGH